MLLLATAIVLWKLIVTAKGVENPRSIHVALETALSFNSKDNTANVQFIDDFQDFLSKVRKTVVDRETPARRRYRNYELENIGKDTIAKYATNLKFTDFIKELIDILKNYKDDDLEDVCAVIDDEIRKYHYKGCKFYELVSDNSMRRYIADKLDLIKEKSAKDIRVNLDKTMQLIENAIFVRKRSELLDYVNSLYTRNDVRNFQKVLGYFHIYQSKSKRANMNLVILVRDSIRSLIFDHYSNLNLNTRRDFKTKLETYFWKDVTQTDNVQHLDWTIQYNEVTKKEIGDHNFLNLRELADKPTTTKEEPTNEKGVGSIPSNNRDKNKPHNININMQMENQMDIVKSAIISTNKKKKNTKGTVKSEDKSVNKIKHKTNINREEDFSDVETTELVETDSQEESATASDELDIFSKDGNVGRTVNRYEDEGSKNRDVLSEAEEDSITKKKRLKKLKSTTPLLIDVYSAEVKRYKKVKGFTNGNIEKNSHKKQKMKGFTNNNNIGRFNQKKDNIEITYPNEFTITPKKKTYKTETTLDGKNRMRTMWEEIRFKKIYHNGAKEVKNIPAIHKEKKKHRGLKSMNIKSKYRPKARDDTSTEENKSNIDLEVNDEIKKPNMNKDFSLTAHLENVFPKESEELKLKLTAPKKTDYDKKSLRTKTDDEESEKTEDDGTNSKPTKEKALHTTGKQSEFSDDDSSEEQISNKFNKRHKTSKKSKSRSKHHKTNTTPTEEETIITTKLLKEVKKKTKSQSPSTPAKQTSDEKSTVNQVDNSEEEIQTTTKTTKKTKKSSNKQLSTTHKSVEKFIEDDESSEEDILTTTKIIKKGKKHHHKKNKMTTPIDSETIEYSIKETNESAEKETSKKMNKKRDHSSKHHTHKTRNKSDEKHPQKDHSKSKEKDTLNKTTEEQTERKKSTIKQKKSIKKSVADFLISIENKEYRPLHRLKLAQETEWTAKKVQKYVPTTPTTKEEKYKEPEKRKNMDDGFTISEEDDTEEITDATKSVSKPTPTHRLVETQTSTPATFKSTSTTRKTYEAIDIPVKADLTGILNNKYVSNKSQEIKPNDIESENEGTSSERNDSLRRLNSEEDKTTRSYLQLIDLVDDDAVTINLNTMTESPTIDIENVNQKGLRYPLSDFRMRPGNKVKMKTGVTETTSSTITTTTTTQQLTTENKDTKKPRKKKKKRLKTTITIPSTSITTPTTTVFTTAKPTELTTKETTQIQTTDYRRNNDIDFLNKLKHADISEGTKNNPIVNENKIDEYYYDNNVTMDYDNTTIPGIGDDIKEFLDKHDIKIDKNDTNINLDAVNAILGPEPSNVKPDINTELKDEKARIQLDRDMIKLYGKTVSHITVSTTPWNTLYTDPIDNIDNLIGMDII